MKALCWLAAVLGLAIGSAALAGEAGGLLQVVVGHAQLLSLDAPLSRVAVGDPRVADYRLVSPTELYVLGKSVGSTNLLMWHRGGGHSEMRLNVALDARPLEELLRLHLPAEAGLQVRMAAGAVVLSGLVSDPLAAEAAASLAEAYMRPAQGGASGAAAGVLPGAAPVAASGAATPASSPAASARVVNLMRVRHAPQVMLDVRIAEVSRSLLDKLGVGVQTGGGNSPRWSILSNFLGGGGASAGLLLGAGSVINLEAEKKDGLVRILAEPSIVAQSGKEGSFLVGGKVFIPVAQSGSATGSTITLEEREYGVGLKFVPSVIDGGRIALKVATEVSELAKESLGVDSRLGSGVLPALTTRRVATSVQLSDGQSLVIGGLIRNNLSASSNAFPFLADLPVLGALFRSKQYAADQTELVVVVRTSLVAPTEAAPALPTDRVSPPRREEFLLGPGLEGQPVPPVP